MQQKEVTQIQKIKRLLVTPAKREKQVIQPTQAAWGVLMDAKAALANCAHRATVALIFQAANAQ